MQTSREVVDNLLRGKPAERVGLMDGPWSDTIAAWVQQGYPTRMVTKEAGDQRWRREDGRWEDVEVAGEYEEPVPVWEHFGYDLVGVGPWFDIMPLRDYDELVEETDAWDVRRNVTTQVLTLVIDCIDCGGRAAINHDFGPITSMKCRDQCGITIGAVG